MRIRKAPDMSDWTTARICRYISEHMAGRAICSNDLRTIYKLDDGQVKAVMHRLVEAGIACQPMYSGGRDNITSYRIVNG